MGWLLEMPNLQSLRFKQGEHGLRLGSSVYTDIKKLRKLQEKFALKVGSLDRLLITDS